MGVEDHFVEGFHALDVGGVRGSWLRCGDCDRYENGENCELLNHLDFIFCDAIKKQTLELYLYLKEFMTPNAVFIADNVISHRQSMNDLFQYLQDNNVTHQVIPKGAGLLLIPSQ